MRNENMNEPLNSQSRKTRVVGSAYCNVVSLFDGMSCLQLALNKAGIIPTKYFASEVDKYAMQVTMANFPNTIQLGDVRNVKGSDLGFIHILAGGSPCQSFSFAGKRKGMATKCELEILSLSHYLELKSQNFEFEGQSYLFWEYMRILEEVRVINPNVKFLLENVLMGEKWQKILTKAIGINPIRINSALLSAQNRQRLYWTNIGSEQIGFFGDLECTIPQPKDKGILLKDILETDVDDKYFISSKMINRISRSNNGEKCFAENEKSMCLAAGYYKQGRDNQLITVHNTMPRSSKTGKGVTGPLSRNDGKTYCLDTGNTNAIEIGCIKFGRTDEAKKIRKESMANGKDYTPFQAKEITGIDYKKMNTLVGTSSKDNLVLLNERQSRNLKQLDEKANSFLSTSWKGSQANGMTLVEDVISGTLRTHNDGKGFREVTSGKGATIPARAREDGSGKNVVSVSGNIRRLTPTECERLQTVPDNYTNHVSDTQRYKMLGNGWTINVIAYIFSYLR